jgi:hypothetical protein
MVLANEDGDEMAGPLEKMARGIAQKSTTLTRKTNASSKNEKPDCSTPQ